MMQARSDILHYATPGARLRRERGPFWSVGYIMLLALCFALVGQAILFGLLGLFLICFS